MLTDTDTGTDRNKKQDLWKAKQRYIEGLEVKKKKKKGFEKSHSKKILFLRDFPGGPGVKNPPTNAGFDSSYGKIPHAVE